MARKIATLASLLFWVASLCMSGQAFALGLGEIILKSHLNQPLNAEIQLTQTRSLTEQEILAGLASKEDFRKAGVERTFLITQLRFSVHVNDNGSGVIKVVSRKPIREPFLNFLVEVHWPAGRLLREYTLLLDPPVFEDSRPPVLSVPKATSTQQNIAAVPAPIAQPQNRRPAPQVSAPQGGVVSGNPLGGGNLGGGNRVGGNSIDNPNNFDPQGGVRQPANQRQRRMVDTSPGASQQPAAGQTGSYKVQKNDTLGMIAKQVKPRGASISQTMIALQRNNPHAFIDDNINLIKAGEVLRIPAENEIKSELSPDEAIREVAQQTQAWRESLSAQNSRSRAAPRGRDSALSGQQIKTNSGSVTQNTDEYDGKGRVTLVSGSEGSGGGDGSATGASGSASGNVGALQNKLLLAGDQLEESRIQIDELNQQVAELSDQIETSNQILKLKDDQLAALQAKLAELQQQQGIEADPQSQGTRVTAVDPFADPGVADPAVDPQADQNYNPANDPAFNEPPVDQGFYDPNAVDQAQQQQPISEPTPVQPAPAPFYTNPLFLGGVGLAVVILGGLIFWYMRRDDEDEYVATPEELDDALNDFGDNTDMDFQSEDETILSEDETLLSEDETAFMGADETLLSEDETLLAMGEETQLEADVDLGHEDLVLIEEDNGSDDIADLLGEADIYIAYGRFDQAVDMLKKAVAKAPNRTDVHHKLLDVFAEAQDTDNFQSAANAALALGDPELTNKAQTLASQLGVQLSSPSAASQSSAAPAAAAAAASASDDEFDFDLDLDEGVDVTQLVAEQPVQQPEEEEDDFGLSLDDLEHELTSAGMSEAQANKEAQAFDTPADEGVNELDNNFDLETVESLDPESELDSLDLDADLSMDDLDLNADLDELVSEPAAAMESAPAAEGSVLDKMPLETTDADAIDDLNDLAVDLDTSELETDLSALEDPFASDATSESLTSESPTPETTTAQETAAQPSASSSSSPDAAMQAMDDELNGALEDALGGDGEELDSLDDLGFELDLPEGGDDNALAASLDAELDAELESSIDITDVGLPEIDTDMAESIAGELDLDAPAAAGDASSADGFEGGDSDEAETKLDLARAYIDMGDREGAKDILDEVVTEGNDQQQSEAKALLQKCG